MDPKLFFLKSRWFIWLTDTASVGTCPGGDLSLWGFGSDSEKDMIKVCRPLHVKVYRLQDKELLQKSGWKPAETAAYKGMHGVFSPEGEAAQRK